MKSIQLPLFIAALGLSSLAQADFIGLTGDVSYWSYDGKIENTKPLSGNNDIDRDNGIQASIAFEHPVPLLPNVKIKYTNLDSTTNNNNGAFSSDKVEFTNTDYILYYEILDNIVSADIGFGLANIDSDIKQYDALQYVNYTMSGNLPIAYASIGGKLPFTGLSTKGEMILGSNGDAKLTDVQAELQYNFVQSLLLDVGAKVGYRYVNIDADKDDIKYKLDFKGPYIGLNAHF
ncbi:MULTISPECIES: TIGR04219 family outer membrane beta-barrel protein [unclassified Acinetobacter]|uniref:TIGR04219 family outer membrane beta-barrel protein n=1 Tax=unclassified Acinetobacter TaxID=196816 RepID=UPI0018A9CB0C|nr:MULTISPECIES: TIGR04219 family outer membrane beta-barrel protein [unclassified Acinetobacter]MBJ9955250.1 TIGR04219 family outer membrane beta-barrel protein [Acinetobacter baumannii]